MEGGGSHLTTAEVLGMEPLAPDHLERYGERPEQYGELRLPDVPGPHPVVALIHGGCWQSLATVHYVGRLARRLTEWGWATWSIEFRTVDHPDGAWPALFEDVAAAVDHLRFLADAYPLDTGRVVAAGHSSGGHLALWVARRPGLPQDARFSPREPLGVVGVVGFAGICGVRSYHALGDDGRGCRGAVVRLLEGRPEDRPERLARVDPEAGLPLGVPQLLLSGEADRTVPPAHLAAWTRAARDAGDDVAHHVVPGSAHFELVSPWTAPFAEVEATLRPWLETRSGAGGAP